MDKELIDWLTRRHIEEGELITRIRVEYDCERMNWDSPDAPNKETTIFYPSPFKGIVQPSQHTIPAARPNPCVNISATNEQRNIKTGGNTEMPRPLKYGQGSITERYRISYCDKSGKRKTETTTDEKYAKILLSQYEKASLYKWHEVRWIDEYGKRRVRTTKTNEQGRKLLAQFNNRTLKTKEYKPIKKFGIALQEWYEAFRKPNVVAKQDKDYQREIDRLPKEIKSKIVSTVTSQELQAHINKIAVKCGYLLRLLITAFYEKEIIEGRAKTNVGKLLIAEQGVAPERQILSRELQPKFLTLLPEKFQNHALVYLHTGCRFSELNRIKESDVDRVNKTISIKDTKCIRAKDRKSGIFYRIKVCPLLPEIEHIKFPLSCVGETSFRDAMKKACYELNIKITTHDLRHTLVTRFKELGVNDLALMEWFGWSTPAMIKRYAHKSKENSEREALKVIKKYAN